MHLQPEKYLAQNCFRDLEGIYQINTDLERLQDYMGHRPEAVERLLSVMLASATYLRATEGIREPLGTHSQPLEEVTGQVLSVEGQQAPQILCKAGTWMSVRSSAHHRGLWKVPWGTGHHMVKIIESRSAPRRAKSQPTIHNP